MGKKTTKAPKSACPPKSRRPDDPAKTSYLFGPEFDDIGQVIASTTGKARDHIDEMTAVRRISNVRDYYHKRFFRPVFQCPERTTSRC